MATGTDFATYNVNQASH